MIPLRPTSTSKCYFFDLERERRCKRMIALRPRSTSTCYLFELERKRRCKRVKRGASKEEPPQYQSSCNIQILPQDTIIDILSRLPIHSLLRCTLVSKVWRDTIRCNTSTLATIQHNRTLESESTTPSLMFFRDDIVNEDDCLNLYLIQRGEVGGHRKLEVMAAQFSFNKCFRIMGSCNGLLCFSAYAIGGPAFVSNPITRECLMLPSEECLYIYAHISGFGFALARKEYKVVRMVSKYQKERIQDDHSWKAEIHTLGTNTWRQLKNVPILCVEHLFRNFSDVLVNGSLHWLCETYNGRSLLILSLDMDREQFGVVPLPKFRSIGAIRLMAWKGCLTLVHQLSGSSLHVWLMKEYNVESSWIKQLNVSWPSWLHDRSNYWPVDDESLEDDLLVTEHPCLRGYSLKEEGFRVIAHAPSLISLKTITEKVETTGVFPTLSINEKIYIRN